MPIDPVNNVSQSWVGHRKVFDPKSVGKFASILGSDSVWAQHAAVEALIDLCGSFEPDPEEHSSETLAIALVTEVQTMKQRIEAIAMGKSIASASAKELLELL